MEMFQRTFTMFSPFMRQGQMPEAETGDKPAAASGGGDIDELKRQLEDMQKKIDRLSDKDKG
jgi:polyhydroxyalkanoate synthesis regulator protein